MYDRFGDASVLSLRETAVPQAARGEVQVRVRIASLNPVDFKLRSGMLRLFGRPKRPAITGVCGTANIDYVRSIGAGQVIDYSRESWQQLDARFDVIFDAAAASTFFAAQPRLAPEGIYINTMPLPPVYWAALVARLTSRQRCVPFMLKTDAALLRRLAKLAAERVIVPHIHETVDLAAVASAQRRMQEGKVHGKVCVRVGP